jgi:hypothetical protein
MRIVGWTTSDHKIEDAYIKDSEIKILISKKPELTELNTVSASFKKLSDEIRELSSYTIPQLNADIIAKPELEALKASRTSRPTSGSAAQLAWENNNKRINADIAKIKSKASFRIENSTIEDLGREKSIRVVELTTKSAELTKLEPVYNELTSRAATVTELQKEYATLELEGSRLLALDNLEKSTELSTEHKKFSIDYIDNSYRKYLRDVQYKINFNINYKLNSHELLLDAHLTEVQPVTSVSNLSAVAGSGGPSSGGPSSVAPGGGNSSAPTKPPIFGGGDRHYEKYLKYKQKYLTLKSQGF